MQENLDNISQILQIQSSDYIESSGVFAEDLILASERVTYNAYQLPKTSLISQQINAQAGEVSKYLITLTKSLELKNWSF